MSRAARRSALTLAGVAGMIVTGLLSPSVAGAAERCVPSPDGVTTDCTYLDTGTEQEFVVPEGVTSVRVTLHGGEPVAGEPAGGTSSLIVVPGSTLLIDLGDVDELPSPTAAGAGTDAPTAAPVTAPWWYVASDDGAAALIQTRRAADPGRSPAAATPVDDDARGRLVLTYSPASEAEEPVALPAESVPDLPLDGGPSASPEVPAPAAGTAAAQSPAPAEPPAPGEPPAPAEASVPAPETLQPEQSPEPAPATTAAPPAVPAPDGASPTDVPSAAPHPSDPAPRTDPAPTTGPAPTASPAPMTNSAPTPSDQPAATEPSAEDAPIAVELETASSVVPGGLFDADGVGVLAAALVGVVTLGVCVTVTVGAGRRRGD
ncbi:hypothetical protein GCU56_05015 [Geodermatophilus sabuli]|uniref:Uncharacterized protein n=1 Tax=Geodermatophilus sabuli TaxID=1564158 RepID=A0A7K3VZA2_9ACTN|nr:hypothetical protein [Geodermatophilus sabuli]NEK57234.1 hypothetical protein [Geodermatophilus sabuli]